LLLGWSLGLSLFLELFSALAVLQGSYFLLLVHISRAKSKLLELFYHIMREVQESLINQATTKGGGASPEVRNPKHQIPNPKQYQMTKVSMTKTV